MKEQLIVASTYYNMVSYSVAVSGAFLNFGYNYTLYKPRFPQTCSFRLHKDSNLAVCFPIGLDVIIIIDKLLLQCRLCSNFCVQLTVIDMYAHNNNFCIYLQINHRIILCSALFSMNKVRMNPDLVHAMA